MAQNKSTRVRVQNSYRQGGEVKSRDATQEPDEATYTRDEKSDASWLPGRKGQGGEGLSEGYGGSSGKGTGCSGPSDDEPI